MTDALFNAMIQAGYEQARENNTQKKGAVAQRKCGSPKFRPVW